MLKISDIKYKKAVILKWQLFLCGYFWGFIKLKF